MMFLQRTTRKTLLHFTPNSSLFHNPSLYFSTSNQIHDSVAKPLPVPDLLYQKHHAPPQVASLTSSKSPKNTDLVFSFLKGYGFSQTQLDKVMKSCPQLLFSSIDNTLKPKLECFRDFGFLDSEIAEVVSKNPTILESSLSRVITPRLLTLNSLLGSKEDVRKLLMSSGRFMTVDLKKSLLPNIEYWLSCGVKMDRIRKLLYSSPRLFLYKPEILNQFVDRATRYGVDKSSAMYFYSVRACSITEEILERKFQAFRELGFSDDDILQMFRTQPQVFNRSVEMAKRVKELLLVTGKYTMESIINSPVALMYSIDKRYKPRLSVLGVLERKNLIKEWPPLSVVYSLTDIHFFEKFVAPHLNEISQLLPKDVLSRWQAVNLRSRESLN